LALDKSADVGMIAAIRTAWIHVRGATARSGTMESHNSAVAEDCTVKRIVDRDEEEQEQ